MQKKSMFMSRFKYNINQKYIIQLFNTCYLKI